MHVGPHDSSNGLTDEPPTMSRARRAPFSRLARSVGLADTHARWRASEGCIRQLITRKCGPQPRDIVEAVLLDVLPRRFLQPADCRHAIAFDDGGLLPLGIFSASSRRRTPASSSCGLPAPEE